MCQVLFTIPILGGIKVFGYGMMLFLAFLGSMNLAAYCARKGGLDPEIIYDLSLGMFLGGLIGARLFYVIQYWGTRVRTLADVFRIWEGGIVLYGSIIGGTLTFFAYRWLRPFPLRPALDAIAPALVLGIAIGRIGCFLNGCCYGDVCQLPWAVSFPEPSPPWQAHHDAHLLAKGVAFSLPVHPTQLYSVIDGLVLMGLLLAYYPLRKRNGEVMALLMVTYPVTRFLIEYLRSDELAIFAGMTVSQNISVALLLCGLAFWFFLSRWPHERLAPAVDEEPLRAVATAGAH
jgi:phosphatidylglycerol:prolipoprotein diacylglycerol transferase